ncbi:unnamed protein product [Dibothriocephalus latus]|uniref:Uncharacterized protein n=1 Tax=Dibothriocephalus latus TaxID=60516 RepID=A0A3P7NVU8_DIBLA|nr:unnamed protein product [Dibothriocephalus latus]
MLLFYETLFEGHKVLECALVIRQLSTEETPSKCNNRESVSNKKLGQSHVIAAEGEHKSSTALKEAANVLMESPFALHLRYLQTLNAISAEKNSTIIFPLPLGLLGSLLGRN